MTAGGRAGLVTPAPLIISRVSVTASGSGRRGGRGRRRARCRRVGRRDKRHRLSLAEIVFTDLGKICVCDSYDTFIL